MYTCNLWCHLTSCYACVGCHRGELDIERRDLRLVGLIAAVLLVLHSAFLLPAAVRSTQCRRAQHAVQPCPCDPQLPQPAQSATGLNLAILPAGVACKLPQLRTRLVACN